MAIVFKDLQKLVSHSQHQQQQQNTIFQRLRDKPFWIWNLEEHKQEDIKTNGDCCFNHIIGLPSKERIEKPLFDYENFCMILFFWLTIFLQTKHSNKSIYG